ncbi:MAG: hypothetical protein GY941_22020 [Planctomycetes bacterium]|nr:hypothetical protein [Planctomycetota bacterium]
MMRIKVKTARDGEGYDCTNGCMLLYINDELVFGGDYYHDKAYECCEAIVAAVKFIHPTVDIIHTDYICGCLENRQSGQW